MKQAVILISGKQGSGKTTLAKRICETVNIEMNEANIKAKHYAFANAIYRIAGVMLDEFRKMGMVPSEKEGELLQMIGTWARKRFGENVWVDIIKKEMEATSKYVTHANGIISVISDCRFPNEVSNFPNALTVRLEAPEEVRKDRILKTPGQNWRDNTNHESETSLDGYDKWDYRFETDKVTVEQCVGTVIDRAGANLA